MLCSQGAAGVSCEFLDVTDPITVTTDDGQTVQMNDATSVVVDPSGAPGPVQTSPTTSWPGTPSSRATCCSTSRRASAAASSSSARRLPRPPPPPRRRRRPRPPRPPSLRPRRPRLRRRPRTLDHRGRGPGGDPVPARRHDRGRRPVVRPGSDVAFRGGGCRRTSNCRCSSTAGRSAPSSPTARATSPARCTSRAARSEDHLLTVRGTGCELNVVITVTGSLAFTGSSDRTSTFVLVGVAAIVVGLVLVVGARRRRSAKCRAGPSTA